MYNYIYSGDSNDVEFAHDRAGKIYEQPLFLNDIEDDLALNESESEIELASNFSDNFIECPVSLDESSPSIDIELEDCIDNNIKKLKRCNSLNNINKLSISKEVGDKIFVLSDGALLCFKGILLPVAMFSYVTRLVLSSISMAFSFAITLAVSDVMFFAVLDKPYLSYLRYILLLVSGIIALSSIKEIVASSVNLFLSLFKGIYFCCSNLVNSDCSLTDFLLGKNIITQN